MVVVDNVNMISVVVVLLCFVHYAGCVSVQSKVSNVDKLKDTNGDLVWIYTKENGEVFVSGSVTLAQIKNGKPVSTTIATITSTVSVTTSPYSGRGWSVSKSSTQVSLSIKGIGVDDDGTYSLVLIYLKGAKTSSDNDNIVLNVLVRPYFPTRNSYTEGKHTLDEGKKFILKCEPEGSPKPIKIDWLKNDVSLRLGKNSDDPNLVFENINRTDDGKYTCQASNTAGIAAKFPISFVDVKYKPVNTKFNYTSVLVDGESGQLKCSAEADPIARYDITGGSISYKDISGTVNLGVVVFTNLNNKIITCLPKNRLGDGPIAQLKLDVQVKPKVLPGYFKDKVNAIHGKNVTIKCRASGKPSPNILWLRDSQPLRNSPRTSVVKFDEILGVYISESILLLAPARRQTDNGRYTCLAKNPYGENSRSTVLRLLYLPEIKTVFRNRHVRVNTRVELTCDAIGDPKVTYYVWRYPNGTKIQNKTDGTLLLKAIQPDEGGRLSCAAGSYLGEGAKKYVHLFVRVPPRIIVPPTPTVSVNVSERLLLFCNASGVPEPKIRWSLGDKLLRVEGEVLDIPYVKSSDRGIYNCTASNGITPNATALSKVIVFFAPEIVTNTAADTMKAAQFGGPVQLVCSVNANPSARLEWLYYPSRLPVNITTDQDIIKITQTNSETIHLDIKGRIGAKYLCHAYNNRGNTSQLYEILAEGIPKRPILEEVTTSIYTNNNKLSTVQVYLKWVPGYDGGKEVSYTIHYRSAGKGDQETKPITIACNCYTINGLEPNKDYFFFVKALNEYGPSNHSNVINIRTENFYGHAQVERYDEGKVVKLDVTPITEKNITKLLVRYREMKADEDDWLQRDMTFEYLSKRPIIIHSLEPEKNYEFQVLWYVGNRLQITRAGEVGTYLPPSSGGRDGNSLSREEIIAIIAGVGGFLLIVILILFLCLIRRRQKPKRDEAVIVMRRQPGSVTTENVTRRSLIGSVEDDPFESAHYGSKEKKNGKIRDSYYLPGPDDMNTFSSENTARHSNNPAENSEAYQPYRFGKRPQYQNQENSSSEDESLPRSNQKRLPSNEDLSYDPGYAHIDDINQNSADRMDGPRGRPASNDIYSKVNKASNNNRPGTNGRGAPPPYRPRSTDNPHNLPPYPDEPLDLDDPADVPYDDPLPPPMPVLPPSRSVPDNMYDHHYSNDPMDNDSTLEREKSSSRTSLPGKPYINVHGKLIRPGSSGRLSSSENVDDQKRLPEPEVPSQGSHQIDLDNDERNLVSYLV